MDTQEQNEEQILTAEEIAILEKLQAKLLDQYSNSQKKDYDSALEFESREEIITPKSITNAAKEIIFMVKVIVTKTNAEGAPEETLEVMEQNYHIPVAPGKDHQIYVEKFFSKFRSDLQDTCQEEGKTNE